MAGALRLAHALDERGDYLHRFGVEPTKVTVRPNTLLNLPNVQPHHLLSR